MAKHHDKEYKEYVAKLVVEEGRQQKQLAYELEIPVSTIFNWVKTYRGKVHRDQNGEQYLTPSEAEQLKRKHEKELKALKEENEILKKAMHYFSKNQE
jgi:transposase